MREVPGEAGAAAELSASCGADPAGRRLAALAAQHGRTLAPGAALTSYTVYGLARGEDGRRNGAVVRGRDGRRILQVARTARRYLSRDWLEDMDLFDAQSGGSYDWQGVEVQPTAEEQAADAKAEAVKAAAKAAAATAKAEEERVQAERRAWIAQSTAGLEQCTVEPAGWTRGEQGAAPTFWRITGDSWAGWLEHWEMYDDCRTYWWLPPAVA